MNWRGVILWLLGATAIVALALLLVPGVKAETSGSVPDNFWSEFYSAAKTAGWFGTLVMASMWWLERGERREMQALIMGEKGVPGLLEKQLIAFHDSKDAIKDLRTALKVPTP